MPFSFALLMRWPPIGQRPIHKTGPNAVWGRHNPYRMPSRHNPRRSVEVQVLVGACLALAEPGEVVSRALGSLDRLTDVLQSRHPLGNWHDLVKISDSGSKSSIFYRS